MLSTERDLALASAGPPLAAMIPYIDEHKGSFVVEPICRTLAIAPSSCYAELAHHRGGLKSRAPQDLYGTQYGSAGLPSSR